MIVVAGSADVSTYFAMRLTATGLEATGLVPSDMDLQFVRSGVAPVAKVDAVALAATDTAHTDNRAIEIDATDQPGLYRVDWPDAAFAAGVREVVLSVKCATAFTEHLRVELSASAQLDAAGVRSAVGLASANLDTQLGDVPTNDELATSQASADDAILAAIAALNNLAAGGAMTLTAGERNAIADAAFLRTLGTEAYAADGVVPTLGQMLFMLLSALTQFGIVTTALTTLKLDGTTTAMVYTLDSATIPTSRVRSS